MTRLSLRTRQQSEEDQWFEQLFKSHYRELHAYAMVILRDESAAEEIVQTLFLKFWEKREMLDIRQSARAFLYKCVYNDSMNYLKHQKVRARYADHSARDTGSQEPASARTELSELEQQLHLALRELPEACRTIFQMSRFEEMRYKEIADALQLSVKTVENQMSKALKILRVKLADYLVLIGLALPRFIQWYRDFFN